MSSPRVAILVLSVLFMTQTSAFADTGAPAGSDLDKLLVAQSLTTTDLEANHAGDVSRRQVEQVSKQRGSLHTVLFGAVGGLLISTLGFAIFHYRKNHRASVFIVPGIAAAFGLVLAIVILTAFGIPSVEGKKVTLVEGPINGFVPVANGGYVVAINHIKYTGVSLKLGSDLMPKGRVIKAYVIPESKIVVAIEP